MPQSVSPAGVCVRARAQLFFSSSGGTRRLRPPCRCLKRRFPSPDGRWDGLTIRSFRSAFFFGDNETANAGRRTEDHALPRGCKRLVEGHRTLTMPSPCRVTGDARHMSPAGGQTLLPLSVSSQRQTKEAHQTNSTPDARRLVEQEGNASLSGTWFKFLSPTQGQMRALILACVPPTPTHPPHRLQ